MIHALLLAALLSQPSAEGSDEADRRALPVLERTETTRATYALYSWIRAQDSDGRVSDGLAAEFHSGNRHRVETPNARVVADCAAQTGTAMDVATGERVTGRRVAQVACGISTLQPMVAVSWLGSGPSRLGPVDRLRIVDDQNERIYVVDRDGILVGTEFYALEGRGCLQSEPLAVERSLPQGDLFSPETLDRSFVPERFRRAPQRRVGDLGTPGRTCPDESAGDRD